MAVRDRITVKTKDGSLVGIVITKQGGSIEVTEPTKSKPWLVAKELNKNGDPDGEIVFVPAEEIVYYSKDREPKPKK